MIFSTPRGFRLQDIQSGNIYHTIGNHASGVIYWRCQYARRFEYKCKAKIKTTRDGWIMSKSGLHNHDC